MLHSYSGKSLQIHSGVDTTCHPRGKTTWGFIAHHLRGAIAAIGPLEGANLVNELTQFQSSCNTSFASMTAEATRPIGTRLLMAWLRRSS